MHPLLERQLRHHRNDTTVPDDWRDFVQAVDAAYRSADEDRTLLEHSMDMMLGELTERNRSLRNEKSEQEKLIKELEMAQRQLLQSEKMASIGQLAAGVAHEINNPIGFVRSNMGSLERYFEQLLRLLEYIERAPEATAGLGAAGAGWVAELEALRREVDLGFLKEDIPALLAESREGIERVRRIVQDLKDFSRADSQQEWERVDLRAGIESTLNIVHNELKYRATVTKEYGEMPPVECIPSQLNQVFLNLLVNAAQAIPDGRHGSIAIRCGSAGKEAWVEVADDGTGIPEETLKKIFDPFFTTKPVGKGTGLGLSLSYGIVEKHGGHIEVASTPGVGTTFRVILPVERSPARRATMPAEPTTTVPPAPTFELP